MVFENEYVMDAKKFAKLNVPKFWCTRVFYLDMLVMFAGIIGAWFFTKINPSTRWATLAYFLIFIGIYRGFFFKWMAVNKQYRVIKQKAFNDKPWKCKNAIGNHYIELFLNDKPNNSVGWDEIKEFREAKTYFNLSTGNGREGVILEKDSFTKGSASEFIEFMKREHKDIPYKREEAAFDK